MTQTNLGSPMYNAPERLEKQPYSNKVDLWSVGVSAYELLFGKFPFNAMSQPALLADIKKKQGANLEIDRSTNNISKACEDFLRRILTYDAKERLSWAEFFQHPLFNEHNQQKLNLMNSVLQNLQSNRMMVTGMWNEAKIDHKNTNDGQELKPSYQCEFKAELQDIDETVMEDTTVFNDMYNQVQLNDIYTHNSQRYEHELNKVRFIFQAVKKLKDLAITIG